MSTRSLTVARQSHLGYGAPSSRWRPSQQLFLRVVVVVVGGGGRLAGGYGGYGGGRADLDVVRTSGDVRREAPASTDPPPPLPLSRPSLVEEPQVALLLDQFWWKVVVVVAVT